MKQVQFASVTILSQPKRTVVLGIGWHSPWALLGPAQAAGAGNLPMLRIEQIARLRLLVPVPEPYTGGDMRELL